MSLTAAYKDGGYVLANPRNHWSALDEGRRCVALTVWSDQIIKGGEPWIYDTGRARDPAIWKERVGNSVRKKHIAYALENGGRFDLILVKAVDPQAEPRKVDWARFWHQRVGMIDPGDFDPGSGSFRMRLIPSDR